MINWVKKWTGNKVIKWQKLKWACQLKWHAKDLYELNKEKIKAPEYHLMWSSKQVQKVSTVYSAKGLNNLSVSQQGVKSVEMHLQRWYTVFLIGIVSLLLLIAVSGKLTPCWVGSAVQLFDKSGTCRGSGICVAMCRAPPSTIFAIVGFIDQSIHHWRIREGR